MKKFAVLILGVAAFLGSFETVRAADETPPAKTTPTVTPSTTTQPGTGRRSRTRLRDRMRMNRANRGGARTGFFRR